MLNVRAEAAHRLTEEPRERVRTGVPRLGVDLDVDEVGVYPYVHAYLPLNRLVDGTVHDR